MGGQITFRTRLVTDGAGGRILDVGAKTEMQELIFAGSVWSNMVDGEVGHAADQIAVVLGGITILGIEQAAAENAEGPGAALIEDRLSNLDAGFVARGHGMRTLLVPTIRTSPCIAQVTTEPWR